MSKKNKNNNGAEQDLRSTRYPIPTPEVANMDDVGYYPDDLLNDKISRLESERSRLLEMRYDPYLWEVELAYLRREQQLRGARSERHEAYLRDQVLRGSDEDLGHMTAFGPITKPVGGSNRTLN
jgi:hypothetical protein